MSNHSGVQAALRASTSKALDYNGDWSAQFDKDAIAAGSFNGRMLAWLNAELVASHTDLAAAQNAYAKAAGFTNWSAMNTLTGL